MIYMKPTLAPLPNPIVAIQNADATKCSNVADFNAPHTPNATSGAYEADE
jgi:hypothetical protein